MSHAYAYMNTKAFPRSLCTILLMENFVHMTMRCLKLKCHQKHSFILRSAQNVQSDFVRRERMPKKQKENSICNGINHPIHAFSVYINFMLMISYNSYYWIRGRRKCRICTHFIIIQMERERGKLGIIISIETNKLCVLHAHTNTLNFSQNPPLCSWAHESDCNRIYLN